MVDLPTFVLLLVVVLVDIWHFLTGRWAVVWSFVLIVSSHTSWGNVVLFFAFPSSQDQDDDGDECWPMDFHRPLWPTDYFRT